MSNHSDVIVVGLGAMGSSAFYQLASSGLSVIGIDRFDPPHSMGSTHGETRIIRRTSTSPDVYVPLSNRSYELWDKLSKDSGTELFRRTGLLSIGSEDSTAISRCLECQRSWGVKGEIFSSIEVRGRFPQFDLPREHFAFLEKDAGYLLLDSCVKANLTQGLSLGGLLRTNEKVLSWTIDNSVSVITEKATYTADYLIIATGPWANDLSKGKELPLYNTRKVLYWFEPKSGISQFSAPTFPVYIWHLNQNQVIYGFPHLPEGRAGIKLAYEGEDHLCQPDTIDRIVTKEEIEFVSQLLKTYLPDLNGTCLSTATCMYSPTEDGHYIVDWHPEYEQVLLLAGFQDNGFKYSSAIGEIAKDLILKQTPQVKVDKFSLSRF